MRRILVPLLATAAVCAADNVRIDLVARDGTALANATTTGAGGHVSLASWGPEEKRKGYLTTGFAVPAKAWTQVGITFTPAAACEVVLNLMGPWKPKPGTDNKELEQVFVTYDLVTAEGATIANGDFEEAGDGGLPKGWFKAGGGDGQKTVTAGAKSGAKAVSSWHNGMIGQIVQVPAGKPVTIKVWAWSEVDAAAK